MAATTILLAGEALAGSDVRTTLVDLGYDVPAVAARVDEAVLLAQQIQPSLVLMEARLDGAVDGVDTARAIKARVDVPVVFVGDLDDATLARAMRVLPHGFLPQPFDERQLRTAVEVA